MRAAFGDNERAAHSFRRGWECFQVVLEAMSREQHSPGSSADRLGVAYNAACAACLAGHAAEAGQLLMQVMLCGGCTAEGIAVDEDLRGLPPQAWGAI